MFGGERGVFGFQLLSESKDFGGRDVGETADGQEAVEGDACFVEHSFDGGERDVERVCDGLIAETTFLEDGLERFEEVGGVFVIGLQAHLRKRLVSECDAVLKSVSNSCQRGFLFAILKP